MSASIRGAVLRTAAAALCLLGAGATARAADFAGSNLGAIPDNSAAGRDVGFVVSGVNGAVSDVRLSLTMTHTFINDLDVVLTSPGGIASLVVFSRTGSKRATVFGASNLSGTYTFNDDATVDLWATIAAQDSTFNIPSGAYRTSTRGFGALSDQGGCATYLRGAFGGLTPAQTNSIWTLHIADLAAADTGTITAATLTVNTAGVLFSDNFETAVFAPKGSTVRGTCRPALFDFTGTGLSSYTALRNTGGGPSGATTWFVKGNDGTTTVAPISFVLGINTDFRIDGDFDGDGIRDAAVWRASGGLWLVHRSSRPTDAPLSFGFGQTGDDPRHVGDFDGDGISDPTFFRAGASAGQASHTMILLSRTGAVRDLVTGLNGHFANAGVDLTGDNIADVAMQSNAGGGVARFDVFNGVTGAPVGNFLFGTPTDVIIAGNHAGNAVYDTTAVRGNAGTIVWTTRDTSTGVTGAAVIHGNSATDFPLSGDYDGDGLDDYAVWRPNVDPLQTRFFIRRSTLPATPLEVIFGQNGDYPVANTRSH